jgi:hypothetical protein
LSVWPNKLLLIFGCFCQMKSPTAGSDLYVDTNFVAELQNLNVWCFHFLYWHIVSHRRSCISPELLILKKLGMVWSSFRPTTRFPWHYRLWRTLSGWAAAAGSLSRLQQTVLGWHVVSTSNPTAAFSAFQTRPLLLYSSNYSVYPITSWVDPVPDPTPSEKS